MSWQIVPRRAMALITGSEAGRVWPALMAMGKIDIAALESAARG